MTREEQIKQYLKERNIPITSLEANSIIEGAKWADKIMIERVLNFIFEHFYDHPRVNGHICTDDFNSLEELEEELIKVMEE